MTKNGSGSGRVVPSMVTLRSCIASSSDDCVLAGARLISSASSSCVNTGPRRKSNAPRCWLKTLPPVTSDGIRSGVNWMRLLSHPSTRPSVRTSSVLPRPGAPSSSTWPRASTAISVCSTTSSWPITARPISARMRSSFSLRSDTFTSPSCRQVPLKQCCEVAKRCQVLCRVRLLDGGVALQIGRRAGSAAATRPARA